MKTRHLSSILIAFHLLSGSQHAIAEDSAHTRSYLHQLRSDADLTTLGLTESYDEAVELEKEIAQLYREIRATKLSQIQRQSLKQSLRQTLLPISERLDPDKELLNSQMRDADLLANYQDELQKLMQENDAIVSNAEELLSSLLPEITEESTEEQELALEEMLQELAEEGLETEQVESLEDASEKTAELEARADQKMEEAENSLEDALAEMKKAETLVDEELKKADGENAEQLPIEDLKEAKEMVASAIESISEDAGDVAEKLAQAREAMERITGALAATTEVDSSLKAKAAIEPQQHTEKAVEALKSAKEDMAAAANAAATASRLKEMMDRHGNSVQKQIAQQQVLQTLARAEAGTYLDLTQQMKGQKLDDAPEPVAPDQRPPPIARNFRGISGRKLVLNGGTSASWFHVNQWYILGPYDNRERMNIQRVYPPESAIDLDAHYLGKNGAKLTWAYDSFVEEMVNPSTGWGEYTIYYGYTELFFEEASDLWIAIGSDDRSDLWINDMPVWHSSNQLKNWSINEGFRKVHFKKGRNKVVFRLENGWQALGFSLLIHTTGSR